ncbi:hypothetical protein VHEMI06143 [[Torrubiella] hemipterigena]|uniref:Peptidase M43 pregnancy-associated plasma-A domain-containing protein n=1 Tax=[Torrubiella] hemipterigena TaxID=1531966 RepID=A0A0A1TKE9_9HYPO|nr:hypothetical protein VHEMI06143 [[Torrubiella] hemipterigena]
MFVKYIINYIALLAATASAGAFDPLAISECGTPSPSNEHLSALQEMAANETIMADSDFAAQAVITIPTYIHVVASSNKVADGYISAATVKEQFKNLNNGYKNTGFQFSLKGTDWTINQQWASNGNDLAMKKKLRKGNYKTLNLYFQKDLQGLNGYCYYPAKVTPNTDAFFRDGCNVLTATAPTGTTATHEVGHWMGLLHTFEGECNGAGDMVADTPACKKSWACQPGQDTCPNRPGKDAINNFMAYGSCRTTFSKGQAVRMKSSWNKYRA